MQNNLLIGGVIGFLLGGLVVSVAATTFDKPSDKDSKNMGMTMSQMTDSLKNKTGDDYDKAFISHMIEHHQSAVDMANLSASRAKHDEIKKLSQDIITAQEKEISEMKKWQTQWGYSSETMDHSMSDM